MSHVPPANIKHLRQNHENTKVRREKKKIRVFRQNIKTDFVLSWFKNGYIIIFQNS